MNKNTEMVKIGDKGEIYLSFISVILEMLIKYGLPAVLNTIKLWNISDPTLEDIRKLKSVIKPPELYFDE